MKLPVKRDLTMLYVSAIFGAIIVVVFATISSRTDRTVWGIVIDTIVLIAVFLFFLLLGIITTRANFVLFYRKVDCPADYRTLSTDQSYWLNGSHPVKYIGVDFYTGHLNFKIEGWKNPKNTHGYIDLTPYLVQTYISIKKEVEPE